MKKLLLIILFLCISPVWAASIKISMYKAVKSGQGQLVGTIEAEDTSYGLLLKPELHGLTPGLHGFHVHEKPNCGDFGMAAGGHLDPKKTNQHLGPYNSNGHLGDLPALYVDPHGNVTLPVLAPRLKVADLKGHALMIHVGGDNYRDMPKMGGGGDRMICGVVK